MNHLEVKQLFTAAVELADHLIKTDCTDFYINYGISKNIKRLREEVQEIDKSVNPHLKEIHTQAIKLCPDNLEEGIKQLPEEEQKEHAKLYDEFIKAMSEPNTAFQIYYLEPAKCEGVKLNFARAQVLAQFFAE